MTSQDRSAANATIDRTERKTLLVRIGIAGVLILGLIGALALLEQQQKQPEQAVPEGMKFPGPSQSLPAPVSQNQASGAIAPPSGEPPVKPEPPAEPERTGAPRTVEPATQERAAVGRPEIEKNVPTAREGTPPRPIVGKGGESHVAPKTLPPPQMPATKSVAPESPPIARPVAGAGFLVQVGVFSNLGNAEELRKKLADAGIPAHIEARVQVGPFATQAEAAAAQNKIKSLGLDPGMLLSPRR
jgi:DedD protein